MKLSVILPVHNEQRRIEHSVHNVRTWLRDIMQFDARQAEIILVENGSTDATWETCRTLDAKYRMVVARQSAPGKWAAIRAGMLSALGEYRLFSDVDLSVSPRHWASLLYPIVTDIADVVIADRELPSAQRIGEPWQRRAIGRVYNLLTLALFPELRGLRDTQCGCKALRGSAVELIIWPLTTTGWGGDVELLARAQLEGLRVAAIPVIWQHNTNSHVRPMRDGVSMLRDLLVVHKTLHNRQVTQFAGRVTQQR